MNISKAAEMMEVTPVTLRYYERVGLIPPVSRKNGLIRDYHEEDLNWISFIKCMRGAGLSVDSLIEYTKLFQAGNPTLEERKQLLINERDSLTEKHKEIKLTIKKLNSKIEDYENGKFIQVEESLPDWTKQ